MVPMPNPSSDFLRSANTASWGSEGPPVDDSAVLAAAASPRVNTLRELADVLQTNPAAIVRVVEKLAAEGLINLSGEDLTLSPTGERALRYASSARSGS